MPRQIPEDRIERLIDAATDVFIDLGYRRTQMVDVAEVLGVGKGTLYLYVESKEALFDLVVRYADAPRPLAHLPKLPVPTPTAGATVRFARKRIEENSLLPLLQVAIDKKRVADPRTELEAILREYYEVLYRNRRGIKLIDRSARDFPDLAALWFEGARDGAFELFRRYLDARIQHGLLRPVPDTQAAARLVIETVAFWALHRHWDPHPHAIDEAVAADTVVRFIVGALAKE